MNHYSKPLKYKVIVSLIIILLSTGMQRHNVVFADQDSPTQVYLPIVLFNNNTVTNTPGTRDSIRINAPFFSDTIDKTEAAILWFGHVSPSDVYADTRIAYDPNGLFVNLEIIDRTLWYDESPSTNDLTSWDSVELLVYPSDGSNKGYRFIGQLCNRQSRDMYQSAYINSGAGWETSNIPFTTYVGWRGDGLNTEADDKGWYIEFTIPFTSLNLSSAPVNQTMWKMALVVHNRISSSGSMSQDQTWPKNMVISNPSTWSRLMFGIPDYIAPDVNQTGSTHLRHKLDGASVIDASVGGHTSCGSGTNYWSNWGDTNQAFYQDISVFNVQNEFWEISDYPCFSRYYVTFPLNSVPVGKIIKSAILTLHQFGGSGSTVEHPAYPSYIQVLRIDDSWTENTITWNTSPQVVENYAGSWVNPLLSFPGWPGVVRTWDVTRAVVDSYDLGTPLMLALDSADNLINSGKYFVGSDTGDWNFAARPTLDITWGDPQ